MINSFQSPANIKCLSAVFQQLRVDHHHRLCNNQLTNSPNGNKLNCLNHRPSTTMRSTRTLGLVKLTWLSNHQSQLKNLERATSINQNSEVSTENQKSRKKRQRLNWNLLSSHTSQRLFKRNRSNLRNGRMRISNWPKHQLIRVWNISRILSMNLMCLMKDLCTLHQDKLSIWMIGIHIKKFRTGVSKTRGQS